MSNSKVDWKFYFSISGHFNHSRACKTKLPATRPSGSLSPRVSPSRAPVLSCPHYFQAPATQLSCYESLPKWYNVREHKFVLLAHEILCHAMDGDNVMWWPECVEPTPPLRKNRPLAAQLKLPFGDSCLNKETISVLCASPNGVGLVRIDCCHQLASSNKLPILDQTPLPSHTSSYLKVRTRSLIFWFSSHLCVR